jgi:hypothetical protein
MRTCCRKTAPRIHVVVDAVLGSEFQCEVAVKTLNALLKAWKAEVEGSHKKNKITIDTGPWTDT